MHAQAVLVLISGPSRQGVDSPPLAFATRTNDLSFSSCSGLLLSAESSGVHPERVVLMPVSALRQWTEAGDSWLTSSSTSTSTSDWDPPSLAAGVTICAIASAFSFHRGAVECTPVATLRLPAISQTAAQLLRGLNGGHKEASFPQWTFEWAIGGIRSTATEQGAFVLCLATPPPFGPASTSSPGPFIRSNPSKPAVTTLTTAATFTETSSDRHHSGTPEVSGGFPWQPCSRMATALRQLLSCPPVVEAREKRQRECCRARSSPRGRCSGQEGATAGRHVTATPLVPHASTAPAAAPGAGGGAWASRDRPQAVQACCSGRLQTRASCCEAVPPPRPGSLVSVTGSPFGCLAPFHFTNAQVNGTIACAFPQSAPPMPAYTHASSPALGPALFALDAAVLPGMEGGLVALLHPESPLEPPPGCPASAPLATTPGLPPGPYGCSTPSGAPASCPLPVALLVTPVSRRADRVQVPLAVSWRHVEAGLADLLARVLRTQEQQAEHTPQQAPHAQQQQQQQQQVEHAIRQAGQAEAVQVAAQDYHHQQHQQMPWGVKEGRERPALLPAAASAATAAGTQGAVRTDGASYAGPLLCLGPCHAAAGPPPSTTARCMPGTGASAPGGGPPWPGGPPPSWVLRCVVMLRYRGSWATGVVVGAGAGLVLTTAHLFHHHNPPAPGTGMGTGNPAPRGQGGAETGRSGAARVETGTGMVGKDPIVCWVRVPRVGPGFDPAGAGRRDGGVEDGFSTSGGEGGEPWRWVRAEVLYVWSNHLDLAVLRLEAEGVAAGGTIAEGAGAGGGGGDGRGGGGAAAVARGVLVAVQELARARDEEEPSGDTRATCCGFNSSSRASSQCRGIPAANAATRGSCSCGSGCGGLYGTGTPVWAVGHSLVGPSAGWPPLVSHGCVAKLLRRPSGLPTLVLATTTTHAGGSGGALLDGQGRLVGLVTSNARHAGSTTLPNLAFCIAAEELAPVLSWAAARGAGSGHGGTASSGAGNPRAVAAAGAAGIDGRGNRGPAEVPAVVELRALDQHDEDAARIWRLQMPTMCPQGSMTSAPPTADRGSAAMHVADEAKEQAVQTASLAAAVVAAGSAGTSAGTGAGCDPGSSAGSQALHDGLNRSRL